MVVFEFICSWESLGMAYRKLVYMLFRVFIATEKQRSKVAWNFNLDF